MDDVVQRYTSGRGGFRRRAYLMKTQEEEGEGSKIRSELLFLSFRLSGLAWTIADAYRYGMRLMPV